MKVPGKLPGDLSIRGDSPIFTGGTANYHYAIGGLPFLSAASPSLGNHYIGDRRIKRVTAPIRKQQFDSQQSPGEQSLDGFWLRSQMSFHGGAGQLYSDPGEDNPLSDARFHRSKNVDPWTRGVLTLLNQTAQAFPGTAKPDVVEMISIVTLNGTGCVVQLRASEIAFLISPTGTSVKTNPSAAVMKSVTTNGEAIFVASEDGVWKASIPTAATDALTWTKIYTYSSTTPMEIAWVKERIVLGLDKSLYELSPSPSGGLPAALPTAFYASKTTGWSWTSISETSPAIYAVGSSGSVSSILKFTLDSSGALPTLTGGSVAATLPGGEKAVAVFGYLGNMLGIGTSRGARVAQCDVDGNLTYGPLLFETNNPVVDWTGRDRFLWCTYSEAAEPNIKLARIDLSVQIEPLRFAYATDLVAGNDNTAPKAVAFFGGTDQLAFATAQDSYREDEQKRATQGYLYTSRVRFSTLEPKNFRSFRLRGPILDGALGVSVVDNSGTETSVINFGIDQTPGTSDVTMSSWPLQDFIQLKFTLNSSGAIGDAGAQMYGWQLKALPGSPRQRLITLPLLCYDFELDKHGQRVGGDGAALRRLLELESLESAGGVTTFQDLDAGVSYDVFIEGMEFYQVDPPPKHKGWGGVIMITLRTV